VLDTDRWPEYAALLAYLVAILWIGIRSAREVRTSVDYTLAGRQVPWVIVLATTAATMVGGGASVGSVANVYRFGIAAAFVTCAWGLQLIFTGLLLAPKLRSLNLITVGDYFELRFGELGRRLAVLNCLIFLIGAVVAQMVAIGSILEAVLETNYYILGVVIGGAVVIFYATIGGIRAVVKTDVLQFVILVGGLAVASAWLVFRQGGFEVIADQIAGSSDPVTRNPNPFSLTSEVWPGIRVTTMFFAFFLGEILVPPYAVRCFIARDSRGAKWGVAGAGIFLLLFHPIAIFALGVAARGDDNIRTEINTKFEEQHQKLVTAQTTLKTDKDHKDDKALREKASQEAARFTFPLLMRKAFPPIFAGVMIAALIAAVMSSADSCLSSLATVVMEDIYRPHIEPGASDKRLLTVARLTTLVTGIGATICALIYRDIVEILEFIYDFWAPAMVVPFVVGILWYKPSRVYAVVGSMLSGMLATIVWKFVLMSPYQFSPALFGFLVAVVTFLLFLPVTSHWRLTSMFRPRDPHPEQS
jgi:SSS family solute:Na+ symporter